MAIHFVRDYLTQDQTTVNRQWIPGYLIGIFMRRILLYTYVGDTNYNLQTVGTYLLATADSTPAFPPTFAAGTKAGINQGTGREFYVWVPPSVRPVSLADVGRLLVLRSTVNPNSNSGIYLINGFEALNLTVQTTSGTGVSPITITTTITNTLTSGQTVTISGVTGNTNANGTWTVTVLNNTQFTINATGNGTGSSGSIVTNSYTIDYRTMGSGAAGFPPQESFDSMNWYLYEKDAVAPLSGAANAGWSTGGYGGSGTSTTPRIILQSPHALGWQVRLCHETFNDYSANVVGGNGNVAAITCIPGFGGNNFGDYPAAGQHLHTAQYFNSNSYSQYAGTTPGFGDDSAVSGGLQFQSRITIIGDDTGQGVSIFVRREFDLTGPNQAFCTFGLPENEPTPLPVNNTARLFCIGSGQSTSPNNGYGAFLNDISFFMGNIVAGPLSQGVGMTQGGLPCAAATSLWTYATGVGQGGSPIFDGSASDSPWLSATEMFTIDIVVGTIINWGQAGTVLTLEPRVIGSIPNIRAGRSNFGEFSLTTDLSRSFQHMRRGLFIFWGGPLIIP